MAKISITIHDNALAPVLSEIYPAEIPPKMPPKSKAIVINAAFLLDMCMVED